MYALRGQPPFVEGVREVEAGGLEGIIIDAHKLSKKKLSLSLYLRKKKSRRWTELRKKMRRCCVWWGVIIFNPVSELIISIFPKYPRIY